MRRIAALLFCGVLCTTPHITAAEKPVPHEATHKQVQKIVPKRDGHPVTLNTFTLDANGNILACVTSGQSTPESHKETKTTSWLQVYSPDGKLVRETALPFNATAINEAPSGIVFLAGDGQVGKVNSKGKLLTTADAPHLGDRDALLKQAEKDAKEQMEQVTGMFKTQLERVETMIKKLNEKEKKSDRDKKRLASLEAQQKMYKEQQESMKDAYAQFFSVEAMMANAMRITSLAVNSKDVFLCCRTGMGYDVWRTDHDFSSPTAVVSGLSGCCGQCDIQADEEHLVLAENTKFKVSLLDREGKRLTSFGSRAGVNPTAAGDGFGSCCNPMNVRCCRNGDILTAESSIGLIKRYNKEGDYLGTVGKAKIGGGCKHVAIGFDEKRDRYYMQYEDKNQICVMWPLSEAPEFTAEELEAKTAMEGLAQRLLGDGKTRTGEWSLTGKRPVAQGGAGVFEALGSLLVAASATAEIKEVAVEQAGTATDPVTVISDATDRNDAARESIPAAKLVPATTVATKASPSDKASPPEDKTSEVNSDSENEIQTVMDGTVHYFKFLPNGKLELKGGYSEQGNNAWAAVTQDLKTNTLIISQLEEGIQYYDYKIQFIDDNTATFTMMYGGQEMNTQTFKRIMLPPK